MDGERILQAGAPASVAIPPGCRVIDCSGETVMPGLIDSHLHITANSKYRIPLKEQHTMDHATAVLRGSMNLRFEAAARAGEPHDRLRALLASIADRAVEHFIAEEKLMRDVGYPRLAQHVQEHTYVKRRIRSLVPQWDSEGDSAEMNMVLLGFLDLWLNTHVAHSDRQLGDFLRK